MVWDAADEEWPPAEGGDGAARDGDDEDDEDVELFCLEAWLPLEPTR